MNKQFVLDIYAKLFQEFEHTLQGLTQEELNFQPGPQSNSIGWLAWHTIRSQDRMNADFLGEEQLWISHKWYAKFNRQPDPRESGVGHTAEQAAAFRSPDVSVYMAYYKEVFEISNHYIQTRLTEADLQRQVHSPSLGINSTVEARILGTIYNFQHVGQMGYVKGILKGIGWYGR